MKIAVITLFPEMFSALDQFGISGRAVAKGLVELRYCNPRDFTADNYQTVDDRPYGGGPGMVMKVEPLKLAIEAMKAWVGIASKVVYLSPQGQVVNQALIEQAVQRCTSANNDQTGLIFLAGRYEGVDERLLEQHVDEEWSIGDYVLSGGELPAMVVLDAMIRLLPDALGHNESASQDSFSDGLLDCPHYTRPEVYNGHSVPPVLLSGDHKKIAQWRMQQSLGRTWLRRPELLHSLKLTDEQVALLDEFKQLNECKQADLPDSE